jgi:hypothetical protein
MGGLLGGIGQRAAATPVGQFVSNVSTQGLAPTVSQFASNLGQQTGLANVAAGVTGLFGGGDGQAAAPDYMTPSPYAVPFQAAEGPVPGDLSLFVPEAPPPAPGGFVGPPSPFKPPNFVEGFVRGLTGQNLGGGADVLPPGAQAAGGVGELLSFLDQIRRQTGGMAPMAPVAGGGGPAVRLLPGYQQALAPEGGLIHNLIKSYTFGLLRGGIPSGQQV